MSHPFLTIPLLLAAVLGAALLGLPACQSSLPNRQPLGEGFPAVQGESLAGETVALPPGTPCVLLVGYSQNAQFDADRWLLGMLQAKLDLPLYEVPTLKGLFPRLLGNTIDDGMRGGIPEGDWQSVVTLYGSAANDVARFTGTENGRNMRVLLLDANGVVRWFHDSGYSARVLLELQATAAGLPQTGSGS
ncbi:MAG: hypothetical protein H6830_10825 [Planctomycetes bacterium]|nr:hypothetical protein [Planctomycetota bacterium]